MPSTDIETREAGEEEVDMMEEAVNIVGVLGEGKSMSELWWWSWRGGRRRRLHPQVCC